VVLPIRMQSSAPCDTYGCIVEVRERGIDHPDAVALLRGLEAENVRVFGPWNVDELDAGQFAPPAGLLAVGYANGSPVAVGAWRGLSDARAELKKMYVPEEHRGHDYGRSMLMWLEATAAASGARQAVLATNEGQPVALALYRSAGYTQVAPFGNYPDDPLIVYLGKALEHLPGERAGRKR
jgi:GNAT superfamily N-acetyltransferase